MSLDRSTVASMLDHTLLRPEATREDVERLCKEAAQLGVFAVCVSPSFLPLDAALLRSGGDDVKACTVVGFPSGAHTTTTKVREAAEAVAHGADEIDMVIDLGSAVAGEWSGIEAQIVAVRREVSAPTVLKVIVESAVLTIDQIATVSRVVESAGADFVKTSTGFHPAGGASIEAVSAMRHAVGGRVGIKASGGVRNAAQALAMIEAGATRIGTSASAVILAEL
jgi:deoxyribose-phosphate aldolase